MTFDGQEHDTYDIAILLPELNSKEIDRHYVSKYLTNPSSVVAFTIDQKKKKVPVAEMSTCLTDLLPVLEDLKVKYLMVADSEYFKYLTKAKKADAALGYVMDVKIEPFTRMKAIYVPNHTSIWYDPDKVNGKIKRGFDALTEHMSAGYSAPGTGIIHTGVYPDSLFKIYGWLKKLIQMDCDLTCDIEGFSLKHYSAGIGSISFAWNQNEGISFCVDLNSEEGPSIRECLKQFFIAFKRKMIYHKIEYDVTVLIYQLFMNDILDTAGMLFGMGILLRDWDDTRIISYLAYNSCSRNSYGLKDQAQEFSGNYAIEEIKDITKIPVEDLLRYNLVDALSTWYVYHKNYPKMVNDQQLDIYETIFKPAILDVIQMQLTGMPVNMKKVVVARKKLEADEAAALGKLVNMPMIDQLIDIKNQRWVDKKNSEYKVKRVTLADAIEVFKPNSDPQLRELLYEILGLPVIDLTKTKMASTGGETLEKLVNHTTDPQVIQLLKGLIELKEVSIILSTFIPALERSVRGPDRWHYLFGDFNLGGTVSGRLSSSNPNMQNIPATGTKYAKIIKECFEAPPGWLLIGLDFNSLEDRISALTTKDPNKLKVYTDGYDGHSLRTFYYFREQLPGIIDTVESINSIQTLFKEIRQGSKPPTFALTYQGTYITLMNNCGFSKEKAQMIEARYHENYMVSDQWVAAKLDEASRNGYITAAFGLRVRTPLLHQVVRGSKRTPYEAEKEGRTAGNALGQSWCLLNTRAGSEFMGKVRDSQYRLTIRPCSQIHDAQYYMIKNDIEHFQYANKHLPIAASWQNHPDIYHDQVKLGGEIFICYPNWAHELTIPNDASEPKVWECIETHITKLKEKGVLQ